MKVISVVIPCRNEEKYIEECIRAIYRSEITVDFECNVYVVDGMSDDSTRKIVLDLQTEFSSLYLIDNHKKLTPFAFNLGIFQNPSADFIQIVGARHIISANYIQKSLEILENDASIWCVGGKIINEFSNETSKIISNAMGSSFGMGLGNFRTLTESGFTDTVTSPLYPKKVFETIGYFDEELVRNQDDDFNFRLTNAGGKVWFEVTICLKYYVRASYKNVAKQFFQYGYWKVFVNQKHKAVTTLRQLVPPLFVSYLFLLPFCFLLSLKFGLFAFIPFFLYLMLDGYISVKSTFKNPLKMFGTFPLLHISYGLGYLNGIFHFLILKKKPSNKSKELSR